MAAGAVSMKLPNFLTTSQDITKGADQAKYLLQYRYTTYVDQIVEIAMEYEFDGPAFQCYFLNEDKIDEITNCVAHMSMDAKIEGVVVVRQLTNVIVSCCFPPLILNLWFLI